MGWVMENLTGGSLLVWYCQRSTAVFRRSSWQVLGQVDSAKRPSAGRKRGGPNARGHRSANAVDGSTATARRRAARAATSPTRQAESGSVRYELIGMSTRKAKIPVM